MRVRCVRGLGPIRIRGSDEVTRSRSITSLGALLYDQSGKLDEAQRATLGDCGLAPSLPLCSES